MTPDLRAIITAAQQTVDDGAADRALLTELEAKGESE